ncbi:MAG: alanine racemase [Gemmatimonadaceae bacterium]|jgi:alanine racemase|nr:alanine racemase [Gemmatimonadaceae bacterium]
MTRGIYDPSSDGGASNDTEQLRAWCTIDLDAVRHNVAVLHARAGVPVLPMVKADAYGLGAPAIAHALTSLGETVWALGVATPAEATALRAGGIQSRLVCTSPVLPGELPELAAARCRPALHRADDIVRWQQLAPSVPWHLAIDTGMHRAGVSWRDVAALRAVVAAHPPEGVFTHFHSAERSDGSRERQEARFTDALTQLALADGTLRHADNSWGVLARAGTPWDLVRPGFALYAGPAADPALHPVLHVQARIVDLRDVEPGDTVSYGATWTATRAARVATIGLGYGDGLRRALGGRASLRLHGRSVPVIGHITMDLTMLDVTDVPCGLGDVVTVLGNDGHGGSVPLETLAAAGALSPYELLTGWRLRLPRVYRP